MHDPIEETVQVLPAQLAIHLNSPVGYLVSALALYGGTAMTIDARRAVTRFRENRKAKKASEDRPPHRESIA